MGTREANEHRVVCGGGGGAGDGPACRRSFGSARLAQDVLDDPYDSRIPS